MTANKGVEKAMDWINSHMDDEDYEEALFIVGEIPGKIRPPSNLTIEERMQKAKELQ